MKKYLPLHFIIVIILFSYGISHAGYRETFEKEFMLSPWAIAKGEISACIQCHSSDKMGPEMHQIIRDWKESWHSKNNISCHNCHGGAPEDASMAMKHQRGFKGAPDDVDVPEFCGTCHIAIKNNYLKSGHGKTLCGSAAGPTCVTCHGSHSIQQANMDIINEQTCTQCHTYERAAEMKQALFTVENKLSTVGKDLKRLKSLGVNVDKLERTFYRSHLEFRALFHSIDVNAVRAKSSDYIDTLNIVEKEINNSYAKLATRKYFSAYLLLLFLGLGVVVFFLAKSYDEQKKE
jgi:hypothetical protein